MPLGVMVTLGVDACELVPVDFGDADPDSEAVDVTLLVTAPELDELWVGEGPWLRVPVALQVCVREFEAVAESEGEIVEEGDLDCV